MAGYFFSESGEALKRFSVRDGMGVERLRDQGIETAFLTREASAIVARRAEKLAIRHCHLGVADKRAFLPRLLAEAGVEADEIAYIGDDVNDEEVMGLVAERGLVGAPLDAVPSILRRAHHCCARPGGPARSATSRSGFSICGLRRFNRPPFSTRRSDDASLDNPDRFTS